MDVNMKHAIFLKTIHILILSFALVTLFNPVTFANEIIQDHGEEFVDENGDGYNDNAPDYDNDGIPNGKDTDFVRGRGWGSKNGNSVDEHDDFFRGKGKGKGHGNGRGHGGQQGYGECEGCEGCEVHE